MSSDRLLLSRLRLLLLLYCSGVSQSGRPIRFGGAVRPSPALPSYMRVFNRHPQVRKICVRVIVSANQSRTEMEHTSICWDTRDASRAYLRYSSCRYACSPGFATQKLELPIISVVVLRWRFVFHFLPHAIRSQPIRAHVTCPGYLLTPNIGSWRGSKRFRLRHHARRIDNHMSRSSQKSRDCGGMIRTVRLSVSST